MAEFLSLVFFAAFTAVLGYLNGYDRGYTKGFCDAKTIADKYIYSGDTYRGNIH